MLPTLNGVGYCARMTQAGDWAFDFALDLAVHNDVRLDIFFFPSPPEQAHPSRGRHGESAEIAEEEKIAIERDVRLYYDKLLGEFINVGFRLCEGDEDPELRRCLLIRREYDVLVLGYEDSGARFGSKSIEQFAQSMPCPTILVGPERADQLYINGAAESWIERLGLTGHPLNRLEAL